MIKDLQRILRTFGLEYFKRYYGTYRGIVAEREDPEFLGRVRVTVPSVYGDDFVFKEWAWPKGAAAGALRGMFDIPNIGDGIWVSFENGDPRYPIWEHGWWAKDEVPELAKDKDRTEPTKVVWQTTSGHVIEMDDLEGEEYFKITDKWGNVIHTSEVGTKITTIGESDDPEAPEQTIFMDSENKMFTIIDDNNKNVIESTETGFKITTNDKEQTFYMDTENGLIHVEDANGNVLELNSTGASLVTDALSLGSLDGSAEPAILGDTAVDWLTDLVTALENVKVTTSAGPMPFLNLPEFAALKAQLNTLKSQKVTLD